MFKGYNDYELLYLISESNDVALDIMYKKYSNFIYKKIRDFNIISSEIDDFYQEGLMILNTAIKNYNPNYRKTFLRFFELLLVRKFIRILDKSSKNAKIVEDYINNKSDIRYFMVADTSDLNFLLDSTKKLKKIEKEIFQMYFIENQNVNLISEKLNISKKQVYNISYRIRTKIKETLK